jgi:hypothetical protein
MATEVTRIDGVGAWAKLRSRGLTAYTPLSASHLSDVLGARGAEAVRGKKRRRYPPTVLHGFSADRRSLRPFHTATEVATGENVALGRGPDSRSSRRAKHHPNGRAREVRRLSAEPSGEARMIRQRSERTRCAIP